MKTHTHPTLRQTLFAAIFLLSFLALTIFLFTYRRDEQRFIQVSTQLFRDEMVSNTLNMHYTLAYPKDFSIYQYKAVLPCYSYNNRLATQAQKENLVAFLNSLSPEKLSDDSRYTWHLLLSSLNTSLALSEYSYYEEPLSPNSGMQSQLPILLAEYTFREKQDIEDYLELLDQTDEYFSSLLSFEQEKAAIGLLQPSVSLAKVRKQCDTILTEEALTNGTHFLQTTFTQRLEELYHKNLITTEEIAAYESCNNRLLRTVMLPAYQSLSDGLFLLIDETIPLEGLAAKPNGQQYYELLLQSETGSSLSIKEIKKLLANAFSLEYQAIQQLLLENPSLSGSDAMEELDFSFPLHNASLILTDLQQRMKNDFPLQSVSPVTIKSVSPNLQDYCAPAFYLTPPLDDINSNVIYINEKSNPAGLDLYTTLAHEGYPGHMYQSVFSNQIWLNSDTAPIRKILWYGGYQEGWALYVEFMSFDYASELVKEQKKPSLASAIQLEKHSRNLQLCLYSLLDIMIHYDNASYAQVAKILSSYGITSESSQQAVYQYIVEEPTNYLKYYLGYQEILLLKEQAHSLWGENYTDYNFHNFLLTCGPSDFDTLKNFLNTTKSYPIEN